MVHPLVSARLAAVLHPIGAVILGLVGPGAITAFAVLHGAGNGLLTIAKGTVRWRSSGRSVMDCGPAFSARQRAQRRRHRRCFSAF